MMPQTVPIAFEKQPGKMLEATLWGFDRSLHVIGPNGDRVRDLKIKTKQYASDIQPFDRNTADFEVFLHELKLPSDAPAGNYVLAPKLELAMLSGPAPLVNAARPIALEGGEQCFLRAKLAANDIQLESADRVSITVSSIEQGTAVAIRNNGPRKAWFRIVDLPEELCWVAFQSTAEALIPSRKQTLSAFPDLPKVDQTSGFINGRFGKAVQVSAQRTFVLPDHVEIDGQTKRLFDEKQGTIEFWIKKQWDDRLVSVKPVTFFSNGLLQAWSPWKLPLNEWAHVAVEWRPLKRDPSRQAVHIYVNGHDQQNYRSTWWEGYSQKPRTFARRDWLKQFVCETSPDAPFAIDEIRVSNVPRYAKLSVELGGQQTFNPARFEPPDKPFELDKHTTLLFHFDGSLSAASAIVEQPLQANIEGE